MWGQHGRQKEVVSLIISSFLTLRAFKQQVDSCYSDLTTVKVSHHQPNVYFCPSCCSVTQRHFCNSPTFSVVPIQRAFTWMQLHKFCSKRTDVRCVRNLTVLVSSKQPSPGWLPAVYPRHPPRRPPHADCLARDITSPDFLLCCRYHFYGCRLPFFWQGRAVHAEVMDCWSWSLFLAKFLKASCRSPLIETLSLYLYSTCFIITEDMLTSLSTAWDP